MKTRSTIQLGLVVLILGCGLYLLDEHLQRRQRVRVRVQRVFDITTAPVTSVLLERGSERIALVRKGPTWFLQDPVRARANKPQVERIVAEIETLEWQDAISLAQREQRDLTLADYGLSVPACRLTVETAAGRAETLHLGGRTPFGHSVYGRIDHDDTVFTLPESILSLHPDDLTTLRDRTLLYGSPATTERIDIHRRNAGLLRIVRQKSGWFLQQPLATRADTAAVNRLLETVFALRVSTFHWDADPDSSLNEEHNARQEMTRRGQFESAGLADDAVRLKISVWTAGDRLGQELLIGRNVDETGGGAFARRGGIDAIYTVPAAIVEACSYPVDTFRSRSVFLMKTEDINLVRLQKGDNLLALERVPEAGGWRLRAPLRAPADPEAVQALIARLRNLKVTAFIAEREFGADHNPAASLMRFTLGKSALTGNGGQLPAERVKGTGDTTTLLLWDAATNGVREAAIAERMDECFTLDKETTDGLDESLISPLYFRHRLMLSIEPDSVRRIQVVTPSNTCLVARQAEAPDIWHCPNQPAMKVSLTAVSNLLTAASRIEAARLVAFMPTDLSRYGLDNPAATLTFGFHADERLQNTLLLGRVVDDAWRYAMIQGHDFVFLLAEQKIAGLLHPLCVTPPPDRSAETNLLETPPPGNPGKETAK